MSSAIAGGAIALLAPPPPPVTWALSNEYIKLSNCRSNGQKQKMVILYFYIFRINVKLDFANTRFARFNLTNEI